MRAVIQRVSFARVEVNGQIIGEIEKGLLVFIGTIVGDTESDANYIATKILGLRIFPDNQDKMNLDISQINGSILLVPQFTIAGDVRKGKRPDFIKSGPPEEAKNLINLVIKDIIKAKIHIVKGSFGTHMHINLENDGPVTILLDSRRLF